MIDGLELERQVRELERQVGELARHVNVLVSELRDDVTEGLAALDRRVTTTHRQALKALTDELERR